VHTNMVRPMYNIYVGTCITKRMSEGRMDHEPGMVCYPVYKCLAHCPKKARCPNIKLKMEYSPQESYIYEQHQKTESNREKTLTQG
jgi:hypothetical protein